MTTLLPTDIPGSSFYKDLRSLKCSAAPAAVKYDALAHVFYDIIDAATETVPVNFAGPFAKTDYLFTERGASSALVVAVNAARGRFRHRATMTAAECEAAFEHDFNAVVGLAELCLGEPTPDNLEFLRAVAAPTDHTMAEAQEYVRVVVDSAEGNMIRVRSEHQPEKTLELDSSDWPELPGMVQPYDQLNLVEPEISGSRVQARYVIYEPDYLVNVTQIASCFESYGTDARISLVRRFMPPVNTAAVNLGNFASQLLDEEVNRGREEIDFRNSATAFFRSNAISLATCGLPPTFRHEALSQQINIRHALSDVLPTAVSGFDRGNVMLEPAFFAEILGLQGRMDLMQLDYRLVVEQKSGKGEWNPGNENLPRYRENHYVQLLLYMAIIRYNYRAQYERNNRCLSAFLMYSRYAEPLIALGNAPALLREALKVRNEIVANERKLASGDSGVLDTLTPDALNSRGTGTLWERYQRPQLCSVLDPVHNADTLAALYFRRMLAFVAKEHQLSKCGNKIKRGSGFAAAWQCALAEKLDAGNIYAGLRLCEPAEGHEGAVKQLLLEFADDAANDIANFRAGDVVILYPYDEDAEPDARSTMVFRCSITDIRERCISLQLRFEQSSARPFVMNSTRLWAIEHDFMDSSYNALYQGLHAFLRAPEQRRDLILFRRRPRVDRKATLNMSHGDFNALALRVKQARDIFLIIGPPGTGKTSYGLVTTLKEQLSEPGSSVLLLSYTNRAVDEMSSKLVEHGIDFMRIGPELSCAPEYRSFLIGEKISSCGNVGQVREAIMSARVFAATVASLNGSINLLSLKKFDLVIIDEASQIPEPHLLGILSVKTEEGGPAIDRIVMIGDHKQLPAVVQQTAQEAEVEEPELREAGLCDCRVSMFERFVNRYGDDPEVTYTLTRQGRMHSEIAEFPNERFYNGKLDIAGLPHQMTPLPGIPATSVMEKALWEHRVSFINVVEEAAVGSPDKINDAEALVISGIAGAIWKYESGRSAEFSLADSVGIIVPYRNQISHIRHKLAAAGIPGASEVAIDTVERFQGSQRDYIIYGFTVKRAGQLRFLTQHTFTDTDGTVVDRKLNVAMTRAREHLVLVGNARLLGEAPVFSDLIDYCRQSGGYFDV